jgi:uncharacterized protein with PQ loop repeat
MNTGLHHLSKRKRITKNLEAYPSPKFWIRLLDRLLIVIAVIGPLTAVTQVWNVYKYHEVAGLSLFSWSSWAFFNIFWMLYGFVHKDKPIVTTYILWFLMNASVAVGIIIFS